MQKGKKTPTQTGLFEVQIVDGPLIWSKAKCGKFPNTPKDISLIYDEIKKAIDSDFKNNNNNNKK